MKVKDALTKDVQYASLDTSITQIAKMMEERNCGSVPVGDNDKLVGMITDRDIVLRCVARDFDPVLLTAKYCMSEGILYCYDTDEIEDVLENMGAQAIKRLPVVDKDKKLVGIVSFGDLSACCKDKACAGETMKQIREAA
ncbi:MAG: CBS domain-containing protein [Alphaproteobacteria bacterium]|nr:CBS domain-containing protein [Alphaproteobacteria bacterium]